MNRIIIGGDIVPTRTNEELFINGNINELIGEELKQKVDRSDAFIVNLETPIVDVAKPIKKNGPNLMASSKTIKGLKEMNISLVGLANNHILDYGEEGIKATWKYLNDIGIHHVGTGENLDEAKNAFVINNLSNFKVGVYACAESEFTIAGKNEAGANPFDPLESFDHVMELKKRTDMVVVLYHGGKEFYRYPSPYLQKVCRKFVEKGADLVVCQHSHCIGCQEDYLAGKIVYGQGNFIFDGGDDEYWSSSLLVEIIEDNALVSYNFIPVVKLGNVIRLADEYQKEEILREFNKRSEEIKDDCFVMQNYNKFADSLGSSYIAILRGYKFWISILNKIFFHRKNETWYSEKEILQIRNIIECEAHREAFLDYLKRKVHNDNY